MTEAELHEKVKSDGEIMEMAVRSAFSDQTVERLDEFVRGKADLQAEVENGKKSSLVTRTFGKIKGSAYGLAKSLSFGSKRSRDADDEEGAGSAGKRRRLI